MADLEFHYDMDEYARSADGYLRARATMLPYFGNPLKPSFRTRFFVIDYLPQQVQLTYQYNSFNSNIAQPYSLSSDVQSVRVFFFGLEGVTKIILERLRPGTRVPSKTIITDVKRGYCDITLDRTTILTAVSFNENGSSKGKPVVVTINESANKNSINFELDEDQIFIRASEHELDNQFDYILQPIESSNQTSVLCGKSDGIISISALPKGNYVLSVKETQTTAASVFKFNKRF